MPNRWIAVFKAEYFTTTARFRQHRRWLPLYFILGIFFFSYFLRSVFLFLQDEDDPANILPIAEFYAILAIFAFFTLFAPIISPLGRAVFDGSANARKEVALASPVRPYELLYGNLASNVVFFLPFYVMVGTVSLSFFIGSGQVPPLQSTLVILSALALIVLIGLFAGTFITPLVLNYFTRQRNDWARALVTLFVSAMLMAAFPLLGFLVESVDSLGWVQYLPFTLAATLILWGLFGLQVGAPIPIAYSLLIIYNVFLILLGYSAATKLYRPRENNLIYGRSSRPSRVNRLLDLFMAPVPSPNIRRIFKLLVYASVRDLEHMARLSIGISATIFFLYSLSGAGLFRNLTNFPPEFSEAVLLFSIILAASTSVYIEASAFIIQNHAILPVVKSAPHGSRRFVIAKILQMLFIQTPIFCLLLIVSSFLLDTNISFQSFSIQIIIIVFSLTAIILGIFIINPSDNEEDLSNFINLLVFYLISLIIAVYPIFLLLAGENQWPNLLIYFLVLSLLGIASILVGIHAMQEMDIETMSSLFSTRIIRAVSALFLSIASWNILPSFALLIFIHTQNLEMTLLAFFLAPLTLPLLHLWKQIRMNSTSYHHANTNTSISNLQRCTSPLNSFQITMLVSVGVFSSGIFFNSFTTHDPLPDTFFQILRLIPMHILIPLLISLACVEEIFFRNYLYHYLREYGIKYAIGISAFLFALLHFGSGWMLLNAFVAGCLLGYLRHHLHSILPGCLIHASYNIVVILVFLSTS